MRVGKWEDWQTCNHNTPTISGALLRFKRRSLTRSLPSTATPGPEKHPKPKMLNSQSPEPPYPPAHFVKLEAHPILYPSGLWRLGVVEPSMANRPRGHALGERKAQGRMAFQVEVGDLRVRPTGVFHAHRHCIEALSGERNSS